MSLEQFLQAFFVPRVPFPILCVLRPPPPSRHGRLQVSAVLSVEFTQTRRGRLAQTRLSSVRVHQLVQASHPCFPCASRVFAFGFFFFPTATIVYFFFPSFSWLPLAMITPSCVRFISTATQWIRVWFDAWCARKQGLQPGPVTFIPQRERIVPQPQKGKKQRKIATI